MFSTSKFPFLTFCILLNPIALRKAKIAYNFGLSEYNRVKICQESNLQCHVSSSSQRYFQISGTAVLEIDSGIQFQTFTVFGLFTFSKHASEYGKS